jgi:hypothetical protein
MEQMKEILRRIHDGETSFKPKDDSPEAVKAFQPVAKRIVAAHEKGYLVNAIFSRSNENSYSYIEDITVTGGLTFEGERFLSSPPEQDRAPADLIKFEPKIFGIKLEGNELYRRLKRLWRNREKP